MSVKHPALNYFGGKWRIAPWIIRHLPAHRCYTEPFSGAASVLLRKPPSDSEAINDINGDVVNFFRVLRDSADCEALMELLHYTPYAQPEYQASFDPTDDPLERARLYFVRSWQGMGRQTANHNSFARSRVDGNRPRGLLSVIANLDAVSERLRIVQIECMDALDFIMTYDTPETLHMIDPPYAHEARSSHTGYTHEIDAAYQQEISDLLHRVRGMVVLCGYECDSYTRMYADWEFVQMDAMTTGLVSRRETLWFNAAAARNRAQVSLEFGEGI